MSFSFVVNPYTKLCIQYFICAVIVILPIAYACMCLHKGFYYAPHEEEKSRQNFVLAGLYFCIGAVLLFVCIYHTYSSKTAARARTYYLFQRFKSASAILRRRMLGAIQMRNVYSSDVDIERGDSTHRFLTTQMWPEMCYITLIFKTKVLNLICFQAIH